MDGSYAWDNLVALHTNPIKWAGEGFQLFSSEFENSKNIDTQKTRLKGQIARLQDQEKAVYGRFFSGCTTYKDFIIRLRELFDKEYNVDMQIIKNFAAEKIQVLLNKNFGTQIMPSKNLVTEIEIINPDQVIATLSKGGKLDMEFIIANGRGYVPSNENKEYAEKEKIGFIPIDAIYSPIERISYDVENARVGQDASYDKLIMNVYTNGSIRPEEAMALGAKILIEHLNIVTNLSEIADTTGVMNAKQEDSKLKKLEISIDDLDFSVRAYNCLKRAGVKTLGDLTEKTELEMMKIRNLGKKSLKEVIEKIKDMGLKFRDED